MTWDNTLKMRPMYEWMVASMTIQVVEFSRRDTKLECFFFIDEYKFRSTFFVIDIF